MTEVLLALCLLFQAQAQMANQYSHEANYLRARVEVITFYVEERPEGRVLLMRKPE